MPHTPEKLFISYSHDSREHKDRVWNLSGRLRGDGIESVIDQYEDSPAEGWPLWCEKQIREADFVLVTCTGTYLKRVMKEEQRGKGLGVTWEADIIRNCLYGEGGKNNKFIPVVFGDAAGGVHGREPPRLMAMDRPAAPIDLTTIITAFSGPPAGAGLIDKRRPFRL